jgi:hypothetical protein
VATSRVSAGCRSAEAIELEYQQAQSGRSSELFIARRRWGLVGFTSMDIDSIGAWIRKTVLK